MKPHPPREHRLPWRTARPALHVVLVLVTALQSQAWASPPPVTRQRLPQIEAHIAGTDSKLQQQALQELASLQYGLSKDLIRLLPRVLELSKSNDDKVVLASMYVIGQFNWLPEARSQHGRAMIEALGKGLASKNNEIRGAAIYSLHSTLVDEQADLGLPILIRAASDEVETVRMWAVISMGKLQKADARIIEALRTALSDPAMQVRRQSASSLATLAPLSKTAIPQLLIAMEDKEAEVAASATHALQKLGEHAVDDLLIKAESSNASVRRRALSALGTSYSIETITKDQGARIYAMVERKLDDPDPGVNADAAVRISIFGTLDARIKAIPILVKSATGKGTDDYGNSYHGIHRCIRVFATALTDKAKVNDAMRGFRQFDQKFLKGYLLETQRKYKGLENGDITPLFKEAAAKGIEAEHRAFAAEVVAWLTGQEK